MSNNLLIKYQSSQEKSNSSSNSLITAAVCLIIGLVLKFWQPVGVFFANNTSPQLTALVIDYAWILFIAAAAVEAYSFLKSPYEIDYILFYEYGISVKYTKDSSEIQVPYEKMRAKNKFKFARIYVSIKGEGLKSKILIPSEGNPDFDNIKALLLRKAWKKL